MNISYNLEIQRGCPLPLGATILPNGVNFAVFSSCANSVSLVLFAPREHHSEFRREIRLRSRIHRTGHIWHVFVANIGVGWEYAYHVTHDPHISSSFYRLERDQLLLDPYAKLIQGRPEWSVPQQPSRRRVFASGLRRGMVVANDYEWGADRPLNRPYSELIIYELHVRGFTRHPSAKVTAKAGTFAALTEKIPYLQKLGITAVELLPIHEFDEAENPRRNPQNGAFLANYWGYSPINWFAPKLSYADNPQEILNEFKSMIKAFHCAGIEVFLDVVFNHTAEGDQHGVTFSLKGFDNDIYYLLNKDKTAYLNYSGCGNTINSNHPVVNDLIIACLRYWVLEMHIDGFRFDLAAILCRGQNGEVLALPPIVERIAQDPILARTKLIAEAWDAAGLYQVGQFPCPQRWAEWNGRFRDEIRRFLKGDGGQIMGLKNRLMGSPDLYYAPWRSINFVTSHDGFTLSDLVSYNQKYNEANGENNQDGDSHNNSWNCGQEGECVSPRIMQLRQRQLKNFLALLFLSQGTPMLLAGDECGRTQLGNNNAYCQDNEISWLNWQLLEKNADLWRFCQHLIHFRRNEALFQQTQFLAENNRQVPNVQWHGVKLSCPDWSWESRSLALQLRSDDTYHAAHYYLIINSFWEGLTFELPPLPSRQSWYRFLDTYLNSPDDIASSLQETVRLTQQDHYAVSGRSVVLLVARAE